MIKNVEKLIEDEIELSITKEDHDNFKRFDHFLQQKINHLSRSFLKLLFTKGMIIHAPDSDDKSKKLELKKMPSIGTKIIVQIPPPIPTKAIPENIPIEILYEDQHLIFVNKPAGMVTHPAPGNYTKTLVNAILYHCPDLGRIGEQKRPGIVHRLDKGTSGVMVIAKSQKCHEELVILFSEHKIDREYRALALGNNIPQTGTIKSLIGRSPYNRLKMTSKIIHGKNAVTNYQVLDYFQNFSHLKLSLHTGRTHQIRVHLSEILNTPIICDPLYGTPKEHLKILGGEFKSLLNDYPHPLLHAKRLGLVHPITNKYMNFEIDPPKFFQSTLEIGKRK